MRSTTLTSIIFLLPLAPTFALPPGSFSAGAPETLADTAGHRTANPYMSASDQAKELEAPLLVDFDSASSLAAKAPKPKKPASEAKPTLWQRIKNRWKIEIEAIDSAGEGRDWAKEFAALDDEVTKFENGQARDLYDFDHEQRKVHNAFVQASDPPPSQQAITDLEETQREARQEFVKEQENNYNAFMEDQKPKVVKLDKTRKRTKNWEKWTGDWTTGDGGDFI